MKVRCKVCSRPVSSRFSYCGLCRRFVWRLPHIVLLVLLALILLGGLIWLIESGTI